MPKRKKKLTLVEILIVAAIGAIFLAIVIPAAKKQNTRKPRPDKSPIVGSYGASRAGNGEAGEAVALLALGFGLGVGATLLYQRRRKKPPVSSRRADNAEEEKPRVLH